MNSAEAVAALEANLETFLMNFCRLPETRVYASMEIIQLVTDVPVGMFNGVLRTRLREDQVQARVAEVTARYTELSVPACWWITPFTLPEGLPRHLTRMGWCGAGSWRGMALDLASLGPSSPLRQDLRIDFVSDSHGLRQWVQVFQRGFAAAPLVGELLLHAWEGADLPFTLFLAYLQDVPVATALLQQTPPVAGIYCVTTLPEARHRGIGTRITQRALETARASGCVRAIIQSTEMGHGIYRRLGFTECCRIRMFERD